MRDRFSSSMITVAITAAAVSAVISVSITRTSGQAVRPTRVGGKPNFSGIWQANNEANWDLQGHAALPAALTQPGMYPYEYARVPAAPVLALGRRGRRTRIARRRAGRRADPLQARSLADQEGERGTLD